MVKKHIEIKTSPIQAQYNFWVGKYMDKFYDGLENKKIVGNKCTKCGDVFVPPRKICGKCFETINLDNNWVELGDKGTLINFTSSQYEVTQKEKRKREKPVLIGMVKIDGSSTAIVYEILGVDESNVHIGMKLEAVWSEKVAGYPKDIKGFKPVGGA